MLPDLVARGCVTRTNFADSLYLIRGGLFDCILLKRDLIKILPSEGSDSQIVGIKQSEPNLIKSWDDIKVAHAHELPTFYQI